MQIPDTPHRNFHGRRHGKALKPNQRLWLEEDLPRLSVPGVSRADNPGRAPLDPRALFGDDRPLWLEVGFGGGEHLAHQARANPGVGLIGVEIFLNGVAMALGKLRAAEVDNVRLHPGDVRDLMEVLPEGCLARAFLLYPDPWPKARHHRRRFVTPEYLGPLARALAPGAEFRVATDIPDYVRQTLEEVPPAGFDRVDTDVHTAWPDWRPTRYEAKALREGRAPHYLSFRRR
ncbi:tRNA (guanine(46)-N(7))-methyltransferase TrmB [Rhodobaculum claviforme]|uniref:tRNA (guanine-N(7)-)-methyltransferase n=1 Tax=Rhodobaculum claviforme TaxID=1549854 RepID=A0A934TJR8_9RHOB|nr:tRNA (guanine(46)-N(7))-methyltransferase TrmB [Rhodobaculum claviforme]MBK5926796.1 tRNA (guanosine(46)-N7)-methyltransferase TrmB [Rhodobaculum claviforme]